ncbi:hypothetical protein [Radicibacter daui]|uniref:hypothetical protein n=1 Tax=Radicibacter daui TaxID=3064829 RepID=UPI0040470201
MALIDAQLADFMEGPVMIVAATRDAALRPTVCRLSGLIATAGEDRFHGLVSASLWPQALANLQPGWPVAVTFANPADYRAFQVKGSVIAVTPATQAEKARAERYVADTYQTLSTLGSSPRQIASWLTIENLHSIAITATAAFRQTPGPGAGLALELAGVR